MKTKILYTLTIILFLLATAYIITSGFKTAVEMMTGWWFEKLVISQDSGFRAPRLWERPVAQQIEKVFGKDAQVAKAIAIAESGMKCETISHTGDVSVFQINKIHSWRGNIRDCTENIKIAKQIFDEQGWRPWQSYNNLSFKKFLK